MFASHWTPPAILQGPTPFADSMLWDLQRRYFHEMGREAWRNSEVPHYVTSNPTMARAYADLLVALLQDHDDGSGEVLHIVELGGGSGRFAFHVLRALRQRCEDAGIAPSRFRYVLTDYADANLAAWEAHEAFAPFLDAGLLDFALFDVCKPAPLSLRRSGAGIAPGDLKLPVAVLANYLFDSIPQDLYLIESGRAHPCSVSLRLPDGGYHTRAAELLARLTCHYHHGDAVAPGTLAPELQPLLEDYCAALDRSYVLFPTHGIRCLDFLRSFSQKGAMLLSADKGETTLESLRDLPPPEPERHGSFSLQVNFHAMASWCARQGGQALQPPVEAAHMGVCALLLTAAPCPAVRLAYRRAVADFGPDDYYSIIRHARDSQEVMDVDVLLACLRFSHGDAHQMGRFIARLIHLAGYFTRGQVESLRQIGEATWENYFALGEDFDWCGHLAYLFHLLGRYEDSLLFYARSARLYGEKADMLYNQALCHRQLGQDEECRVLCARLAVLAPDYPGLAGLAE